METIKFCVECAVTKPQDFTMVSIPVKDARDFSDGLFSRKFSIGPAPKTNSATFLESTEIDASIVGSRNVSLLE